MFGLLLILFLTLSILPFKVVYLRLESASEMLKVNSDHGHNHSVQGSLWFINYIKGLSPPDPQVP
jgi:hypothetical protein